MRVFVASFFFPPTTTSASIGLFKLLSNSKNDYEVCAARSDWCSYGTNAELTSENTTVFSIETDDKSEWVEFAVAKFREEYPKKHYDCFLTRSMPPESVIVGERIHAEFPDVPWIAYFGDPISRIPRMMNPFVENNPELSPEDKKLIRTRLKEPGFCEDLKGKFDENIDSLCECKRIEMSALFGTSMLMTPTGEQAEFILCGMTKVPYRVIPHTFDPKLFEAAPAPNCPDSKKATLVYIGSTNSHRPMKPLISALNVLQKRNPALLDRLSVRLIGTFSDNPQSLVYNYQLHRVVSFEEPVDYLDSLRIMQEADWLVHIDGRSSVFKAWDGAIYMAGKLGDYLGTNKPILALTGLNTPASRIVQQAGGRVVSQSETSELAFVLEQIARGSISVAIDDEYRKSFDAALVSEAFDEALVSAISPANALSSRSNWPNVPDASTAKTLSICIPSYNVASTLDRCLFSIVSCKSAESVEVLVINDGSTDATEAIGALYEKRYPTIVKVVTKKNGGHGSTINEALKHATGTFFKVVDGDDWVDPNALDDLIATLEQADDTLDMAVSDYYRIGCVSNRLMPDRKKSEDIEYYEYYRFDELDVTNEFFTMANTTYRTAMLRDNGLSISEKCFYCDNEYAIIPLPWVRGIVFTNRSVYYYSVGGSEQSTNQDTTVQRYDDRNRVLHKLVEYYANVKESLSANLADYFYEAYLERIIQHQYRICLVFDSNPKRGYRRAKALDEYLKSKDEDLYEGIAERLPVIKRARELNFNPSKMPEFEDLDEIAGEKPSESSVGAAKKIARNITRKVMSGGIGKEIAKGVAKHQEE